MVVGSSPGLGSVLVMEPAYNSLLPSPSFLPLSTCTHTFSLSFKEEEGEGEGEGEENVNFPITKSNFKSDSTDI